MKYIISTPLIIFAIVIFSIEAMGQLSFDVEVKHASCPNKTDAEIAISITNGQAGNIVVQWENLATLDSDYMVVKGPLAKVKFPVDGEKKQPLSVGEIVVTVIDVSDAKNIDSQVVTTKVFEPKAIEFSVKRAINGLDNGEIHITTTDSEGIYNYKYSIDDGETFQQGSTFKHLKAKPYILKTIITTHNTTCSLKNSVEIKTE